VGGWTCSQKVKGFTQAVVGISFTTQPSTHPSVQPWLTCAPSCRPPWPARAPPHPNRGRTSWWAFGGWWVGGIRECQDAHAVMRVCRGCCCCCCCCCCWAIPELLPPSKHLAQTLQTSKPQGALTCTTAPLRTSQRWSAGSHPPLTWTPAWSGGGVWEEWKGGGC